MSMQNTGQQYNWSDPDAYEAFMGRWSVHLARRFLALVNVPPGSRVLDVACGTGVLTRAFADAGAHVIGIDASEGYLEGARRGRSHPNIRMKTVICGKCGSPMVNSTRPFQRWR